MLYFHNISQEMQKFATHATKSSQLLRGVGGLSPQTPSLPLDPAGGTAPDPKLSPNICYFPQT